MDLSQLIAAIRPGLTVARWQIDSVTDELILEIFQEAPFESGLLDAIVLSVVLLRSGNPLGDCSGDFSSNPIFFLPINSMSVVVATIPGKASQW